MIDQVTGTVVAVGGTWVVLDVAGVGFRALCTPATVAAVRQGSTATLYTSLVVREDSLTLYGFADPDERDAFQLVQSASGIGPKIAQAVVSVLPPADLARALASENLVALMKVPGIGRKGAQRMVLELKDKALQLGDGEPGRAAPAGVPHWREQVRSGLETLGWSTRDADAACDRVEPLVADDPSLGIGELMRAALRSLAR